MNLFGNSRRLFITGGASSVALVSTVALIKSVSRQTGNKISSDPTPLSGGKAGVSEADMWAGQVDRPFTISGAGAKVAARLTSVKRQTTSGKRPAQLRQQPLALTFTLEPGFDTTGEAIYAIKQTGGIQAELFLQRGSDATGTRLVAILG